MVLNVGCLLVLSRRKVYFGGLYIGGIYGWVDSGVFLFKFYWLKFSFMVYLMASEIGNYSLEG